ncbi:hypothetical protein LTR10_002436 [Elasticomyces elasticus]|nr:hypothetical protein LTR10_002436 [Elasticomyces elasticus]KAK4973498.1 hypothetical protein LTR42_005486 [Elasticomyces elasticus]
MASNIDEEVDMPHCEHMAHRKHPDPTLTVEDLTLLYTEKQRIWAGSTERAGLIDILDARRPADRWQLTEAICLGTGSFSEVWLSGYDGSGKAMLQFAAFMDVVAHLQLGNHGSIRSLIQDPSYHDVDRAFLESLGISPSVSRGERSGYEHEHLEGLDALESITGSSFICELGIEQNDTFMRKVIEFTPALMIASGPPTLEWSKYQEEMIVQDWSEQGSRMAASIQGMQDYNALRYQWIERYEAEELPGWDEPAYALGGGLCLFALPRALEEDTR